MEQPRDILLTDSSCLEELSKNQQLPVDLIEPITIKAYCKCGFDRESLARESPCPECDEKLAETWDATELKRFIKNDNSVHDGFYYKYAGINSTYLEQNSSHDDSVNTLADQCLSIFAGRRVVLLKKICCGDVQKVIGLYKWYVNKINSINSTPQDWILVLILESELTEDDIEALKSTQKLGQAQSQRPRIYLLGPKLNLSKEGMSVDGINIWSHAVPPLLSRLRVAPPTSPKIWAWRSMVFSPELPNLDFVRDYKNSIEEHLLLAHDEGTEKSLKVPKLPDPMLEDLRNALQDLDKKEKHKDKEYEKFLGSELKNNGVKSLDELGDKKKIKFIARVDKKWKSAKTILSLILKSWTPRAIIKRTRKLVRTIGLAEVGIAKSRVARLHNLTQEDSQGVSEQELELWKSVDDNPRHLLSASGNIIVEMTGLNKKIIDHGGPWKNLLDDLRRADAIKKKAEDAATILEKARAYYIAFNLRLLLAFVSILVVFYITFVVLYPVISFFGMNAWSFWIATAMGVAGVVAAMFWTFIQERNALKKGAMIVDSKIEDATKENKASHAYAYMIDTIKNNRCSSWIHSLNKIKKNVSRLQRTVEDATRKITSVQEEIDNADDADITEIQTGKYRDNLYVWSSLNIAMGAEIGNKLQEHIKIKKGKLSDRLRVLWKKLAECDSEKNGYYPVDYVSKTWSQSIKTCLYEFQIDLTNEFVSLLKENSMFTANAVERAVIESNGYSSDDYPFLSIPITRNSRHSNGMVYYLFKDDDIFSQVQKKYNTNSKSDTSNISNDECSYFGLVVEEIELDLENQECGVSH